MGECDCLIGILNDYCQNDRNKLFKSDYISKCVDNKLAAEDYINGRKSLSILFVYCPWCGKKLDWKKLRFNLKNR